MSEKVVVDGFGRMRVRKEGSERARRDGVSFELGLGQGRAEGDKEGVRCSVRRDRVIG